MRKRFKKGMSILAAAAMTMSTVACAASGTEEERATATPVETEKTELSVTVEPTVTPVPTLNPIRDLGGMEIIIGDHWTPEEWYGIHMPDDKDVQWNKLQEKHNFSIRQMVVAGWGEMEELYISGVLEENPVAQVFILDTSFLAKPMAQGLFYDLATLEEFDFTEEKWNQDVIEWMTRGDSIYGMDVGRSEPRLGVFWNKRLFEEAGIDPDLPYELQKSGAWTWEKFREICEKLTKDIDGDGITDVYAMCNFGPDICKALIASTGEELITLDENNNYVNNSQSPKILEALEFAESLNCFEKPQPEGEQWDWYKGAFGNGEVAIQFNEVYIAERYWMDCEDDFGFVCCPRPNETERYHTIFKENVTVMPSCFDAETAADIAFAYDLWASYEPDNINERKYGRNTYYVYFRDERAVDETIEWFYKKGVGRLEYLPFVDGISYGDLCYSWPFTDITPEEKIAEIKATWDAAVEEANR